MRTSLVALALLAPNLAGAQCIESGLITTVGTTPQTKIGPGGGLVVVAASIIVQTTEKEPGNRPDWKVRIGDKTVAPKIDALAPGLYVYRLAGAGAVTIFDEKNREKATATVTTSAADALPAPKVDKLQSIRNWRGYHTTDTIAATLSEAPPADAYAIVIADAKTGKPLSWHAIEAGNKVQLPYEHNDCKVMPNGSDQAKPGTTATVFWVSFDGHVSARSKPIKIELVPTKP